MASVRMEDDWGSSSTLVYDQRLRRLILALTELAKNGKAWAITRKAWSAWPDWAILVQENPERAAKTLLSSTEMDPGVISRVRSTLYVSISGKNVIDSEIRKPMQDVLWSIEAFLTPPWAM